MNIKIMSRDTIEMFCEYPFVERIALISITDYGYDFAELKNKPQHLLQLAFDDVDGDVFIDELSKNPSVDDKIKIEKKYHMFFNEQAKQIVEFVKDVWDKVDVIICQLYVNANTDNLAVLLLRQQLCNIHSISGPKHFCDRVV